MVSSSQNHLGQRYSLLDEKRLVLPRTARGGTLALILTPDVIPVNLCVSSCVEAVLLKGWADYRYSVSRTSHMPSHRLKERCPECSDKAVDRQSQILPGVELEVHQRLEIHHMHK